MSEILEVAHDMGCDLAEVGTIDANTMRELDTLCLPPRRLLAPDAAARDYGDHDHPSYPTSHDDDDAC